MRAVSTWRQFPQRARASLENSELIWRAEANIKDRSCCGVDLNQRNRRACVKFSLGIPPRRRTDRLCNVCQTRKIQSREALMTMARQIGILVLTLLCGAASAAEYPAPKQGEWIARDFTFHSGET